MRMIVVAAALALVAPAASAMSVSFTGTLDAAEAPWTDAAARTLLLPRFAPGANVPDGALLTGASIALSSTLGGSYTFGCFSGACTAGPALGEPADPFVLAQTTLSGPGLSLPLVVTPNGGVFGVLSQASQGLTVTGFDTAEVEVDITGFGGLGDLEFLVAGTAELQDELGGAAFSFASLFSDASVTITYSFVTVQAFSATVVPAPAAAPLLVSAVLAVALLRRRRRA